MKKKVFFFLICIGFCLNSCVKPLPQIPANKNIESDTKKSNLLILNQNLAIREDSIVKIIANKLGNFKKNELGFWYKIYPIGNGTNIKDSISCDFYFKIYNLKYQLVQQGNKKAQIGKKQLIVGLEEGLKLMHKGDSATFIIPWYLGFGMSGENSTIQPYTSLIFRVITIK